MMQSVLFFLILGLPFFVYLLNAYLAQRDARKGMGGGIAAGIPRAKEARSPKPRSRKARIYPVRTVNCGRTFNHFALAILGSSNACRYCTHSETVAPGDAPADEPAGTLDDTEAAIRAAEEIIDRSRH